MDTVLTGQDQTAPREDHVKSVVLPESTSGMYDRRLTWQDDTRSFETGLKETAAYTPEEAQQTARIYSNAFAALSLTAPQAKDLFDAVRSAAHRPPSDADRERWQGETRAALRQEFGLDGAAQALRDAQALIRKVPALHRELNMLGIDGHPRVIRAIADRARQARRAGKL